MNFKHTFIVFVDNFSVTYKQLLYRIIIAVVAGIVLYFGLSPFIRTLMPELNRLLENVHDFIISLLNGNLDSMANFRKEIIAGYEAILHLFSVKTTAFVLSGLLLLLVYIVATWFSAIGNYAAACVINDKMSLRANSPFFITLIKNLKAACIYSAIYVPLSIVYDLLIGVGMFFLIFSLFTSFLPLLVCIFLFALVMVVSIAVKMTFTADFLPALIRGKAKYGAALKYTFSRKNKSTFNVLSNFLVIGLIIMGLNVAALLCTLGVGLLITVPASFLILISFEFVNYYDREEIKYFIDKNTIVKPAKERALTREEFFRGEDD